MKNDLMIFVEKEQAVVSSRTIADKFEKEHKNVLQAVQNLMAENSAVKSMFHKSYFQVRGKSYPEFLINRDGFSLLAMGFTGEKALEWKLKYINAFNKMEAFIRERQSTEWLLTRKQGKLIRRDETDTVANLIDYAKSQGSRHADKLYMTYSKLVNSLVEIDAGQRDKVPFKTIATIGFLEDMILHTIDEEMQKGTHYKKIYQICKSNGEQIMRFAYLPKLVA
jgi:Rha family phage regulatory protein